MPVSVHENRPNSPSDRSRMTLSKHREKVGDRTEIDRAARGIQPRFLPMAVTVKQESGITGARATQIVDLESLGIVVPQNAVGVVVRLVVNPASNGQVQLMVHGNPANSGSSQAVGRSVSAASGIGSENQCIAPLINGGICFETTTAATSYTYTIFLAGWILQ